ncbi:agmatine deiminase family protein [Methanospirillum stamsii]|uniref:Peptidyl-arginine deiminase n=1 Tax=Methanospirillum stamsii TaxID=1277351 RepID=A0A2V2MVF5_9EURY|nr:agmatine deiminase family protein [Methanospirillum stamsii]PWR70280.1 peptidyl-arginine deiminase [Methanospirillum stamsii]
MNNDLRRIALIQTYAGSDIAKNLLNAETLVLEAARKGADIICLPELFSTIYFPQYIGLDITQFCISSDLIFLKKFRSIAEKEQIVLIVPYCEKDPEGRVYNSAVVIDTNGSPFSPYHKVHIPQDPFFYEKGYFCPGDGYKVFHTKHGKIAVLICYDQWFCEAARSVALMGAEIIMYPTAIGHIRGEIPGEGNWKDAWQTIQRSHAIANSVPVAAVNRCGWEGELFFFGGSFICDAFGNLISEAGEEEQIIYADLSLSDGPAIREAWGFFRNRRTDTYHSLVSPECEDGDNSVLTPANQGYHMPAEWEPHESVWMSWPHNDLTFPHLEAVEETYLKILKNLEKSEQLNLLVRDGVMMDRIMHMMQVRSIDPSFVTFYEVQYSDVWIRDYGPTFVINRALRKISAVSWNFNAWGDKYDELIADGTISRYIPAKLGIHSYLPGIILEGGSIDVNGMGCVLTTHQCLLNRNRNPHLSPEEIEQYLSEYLCVKKIIWLNEGIVGDDTDGHIDDIARFVNPSTIVCAIENNPADENYTALQENLKILQKARDQDNNPFTIIPIPMPSAVYDEEYRYPASYLNFFISNSVVLVPVFQVPEDRLALDILQNLFPERRVIGIESRELVEGFGTIHCATQQQPCINLIMER